MRFYATNAEMTMFPAGSSDMPPFPRAKIHPVLRTATQEAGRLCAMVAGYGALVALFVLAAVALWGHLPVAVADSRLVPIAGATDTPLKLRGSL